MRISAPSEVFPWRFFGERFKRGDCRLTGEILITPSFRLDARLNDFANSRNCSVAGSDSNGRLTINLFFETVRTYSLEYSIRWNVDLQIR